MTFDTHLNDVQITTHFNLKDFQSPDTAEVKIYIPLVKLLQKIQDRIPAKMRVLSGYRTRAYNQRLVNAVTNSAHLYGLAVDVQVIGYPYDEISKLAHAFGIQRVKIYPVGKEFGNGWIHLGFNSYPIETEINHALEQAPSVA